MHPDAVATFVAGGGFATTAELLNTMTRQQLDVQVRKARVVRVWRGVYSLAEPNLLGRLAALDLFMGQPAVPCMGTAAALYGFDVENTTAIHVLDPGARMRSTTGLTVHQRAGAPLRRVGGRLVTAPAWTAVETARELRRPRALATLDAALRSGWCTHGELERSIHQQRGRRGIVALRGLVPHADARAESAMESEARLVMIDHDLPLPVLQHDIRRRNGGSWRVDFAWPDALVAAEYESIQWHAGRSEMLRDKMRSAEIQDLGWTLIPIVVDDVRHYPDRLAERIARHLDRPALAG